MRGLAKAAQKKDVKADAKLRTNDKLLAAGVNQVRLVGLDNVHTIMPTKQALQIAKEAKLDLVEVRACANPI